MAILSLLLVGFVGYYISWVVYARWFHPYSKYPGPFLASISRLWIAKEVAQARGDRVVKALHDKYGPIIRIAPDEVHILDPTAIKTLYGAGTAFTKTDFYTAFHAHWARYPEHFVATDETMHSQRRRLVNHIYSMTNISRFEPGIDTCTSLILNHFHTLSKSSSPTTDLSIWFRWYAFDVVGELFFSHHFGFLAEKKDYKGWIESTDLLIPFMAIASVIQPWLRPFLMFAGILKPSILRGAKMIGTIEKVCQECIDTRVKEMEELPEERKEDLLGQFFGVMESYGDEGWFGGLEIKGEIYTALMAGSDTTAIALTSILYHLLKKPETYRKLKKEIDDATKAGELSKPFIRYQEASKLRYLDAVVKEGMRIHASVALSLPRHVPEGGAEVAGEWFLGGYRVGVNPQLIQRDRSVYGDDADEFRPERWLEGDAANMDRHILTWGDGAHLCLGKNIALMEIYKLVPELIRSFDMELVNSDKDWTVTNLWFNKPSDVNVRVKARK
ncbi:putative cytochrome P450 pisatin demethylase-like protein [Podospora fimiseda]|uniref:Cytochrome P450 pisatin demethylase-like protein n=1 Tax=Podospora fimiseda TaxID=252190 RepID=A0AAN7BHI6_9PEZI|nr:putative cytochrome P450 pisatin demethylase-like protein [Podospora fimiseda]